MTLIEVFTDFFKHLKPNQELATKIYQFQVKFVNKNQEHIEFFGGNLTGVNVIRFTDKDFNVFYNDILKIDYDDLSAALIKVDAINENFKISSDTFNLTCFWLMHFFLTSNLLTNQQKERAALDAALLFNYRCIAALTAYYFRYPIDKKLAEAVYAVLSQRYLLKKLGNWNSVMEYRAYSMFAHKSSDRPESIHRSAIISFKDDLAIVYALNDSQSRVRDILKNIYAEFIRIHESGERISTTGLTGVDSDGAEIVKDKVHGLEIYVTYLLSLLPDTHAFVKDELVDIVIKLIYTTQKKNLVKALLWFSENSVGQAGNEIETFIKNVMIHSYQYLLKHNYILKNKQDISGLISKLRNVYTSSRSNEIELLEIRKLGDKLVLEALGKINEQALASVRTSVILYLSLRAYTKQHYQSR